MQCLTHDKLEINWKGLTIQYFILFYLAIYNETNIPSGCPIFLCCV
jgi:hypothetical protein